MKKTYLKNKNVSIALNNEIELTKADINKNLERLITTNKFRICSHNKNSDKIHEMIIFHKKDHYVRPHKHINKSESYHLIIGRFDLVFFTENGEIDNIVEMGNYNSDKNFYFRIQKSIYHTLIIKSKICIFHETTNGPFKKDETIYAHWSPSTKDKKKLEFYYKNLKDRIKKFNEKK